MKKEELYGLLYGLLHWIKKTETQTSIANAIYFIIDEIAYSIREDIDFRERIAKAIAMLADDVEEIRRDWKK